MIYKTIDLKFEYEALGLVDNGFVPTLTLYAPDNSEEIDHHRKRRSVIICPGGGYEFLSDREAEPIALRFLAEDMNCFVLRYSTGGALFPTQLFELCAAFALIRANAEMLNVDKEYIFVCGFSAGGHLAASLAVFWNADFVKDVFGEVRPAGAILSYAVLNSAEHSHGGSFKNILGPDYGKKEKMDLVSPQKQVTPDTPPCFLWHTANDELVPVENSLLFANELSKNGVPFELHVFPDGAHGLSLANSTVYGEPFQSRYEIWTKHAADWMKEI